jgi:hypothetical protein
MSSVRSGNRIATSDIGISSENIAADTRHKLEYAENDRNYKANCRTDSIKPPLSSVFSITVHKRNKASRKKSKSAHPAAYPELIVRLQKKKLVNLSIK